MTSGRDRRGAERKAWLEKQKLIHCGRCPYHRGENAQGVRHPKPDRYKDRRKGR